MTRRFGTLLLIVFTVFFAVARADDLPVLYEQYLDLAEPDAVTYVTDQLNAAGITETDYPTLYTTLQQSQAIYATANSLGINIPEIVVDNGSQTLQPIYIVVPSYASATTTLSAESITSIPNFPTTTVQTIGIYSGDTAVADPTGDITVGGISSLLTVVSGSALSGVSDYTAEGASTFIYPASVLGDTVMAQLGLTADDDIALAQATDLDFTTTATTISITNTAPVDTQDVGFIKVCLVRGDSDCSYTFPQENGEWIMQLPLSGSVTFSEAIATDPTTGLPTNPDYSVAIYYPDLGGGCIMPDTDFANQVTV
ncbi:MAG: hypothetical protein JKY60_11420, partial [Kordiimonadaceae bacterium]|nr:hypothetical protein [Kordiimonadaceae bacterium]